MAWVVSGSPLVVPIVLSIGCVPEIERGRVGYPCFQVLRFTSVGVQAPVELGHSVEKAGVRGLRCFPQAICVSSHFLD